MLKTLFKTNAILALLLLLLAGCATMTVERKPNGVVKITSGKDVKFDTFSYSHTSTNGEVYTFVISNYNGNASSVIDAKSRMMGNIIGTAIAAGIKAAVKP
jgi:hypothetical protein